MADHKDFVGENDQILEEWEKFNKKVEKEPNFAPDGILFKGKISDEDGYSERYSNKKVENKLWQDAPIRYLFLTKDQNAWGEGAWDVRSETARKYKSSTSIPYLFFRNLLYLIYGLTHTSKNGYIAYEDFTNEQAIFTYDNEAIARINVKKQAGGSSISNKDLQNYLERDKTYILRQIECLDADLIICCGYSESVEDSGNLILNFLNNNGYHFEEEIKGYIYYDHKNNKAAINAWHLSYRGVTQKEFYDGIITAYHEFLKKNPTFLESHRTKQK